MKRAVQSLALVAASTLFTLLVFELLLRAIGYSAPVWAEPDSKLGWRLRPGVQARYTGEGDAFVSYNAAGWRDREHAPDKPEDVYRIAVLGDSYSEARQVPVERTFWALLPEQLERCGFRPGRRIESMNFGVPGYSTAQEYLLLKSTAMRYRPDLVLLQFTNGNDVADNSYEIKPESRPYFRFGPGGELRLNDSFTASAHFRSRASKTAALVRAFSDHLRLLQMLRAVRQDGFMRRARADPAPGVAPGLEPLVLRAPQDPRWEQAWQVTEALIAKIRDHALSHGAGFLVMTVPFAIQVHPHREVRRALQEKLGVRDLFYPDRRVSQFAKRSGITAVTLAPEMQRIAEQTGAYLHGFPNASMGRGHWNEHGHRLAAQLIAQHLCEGKQERLSD